MTTKLLTRCLCPSSEPLLKFGLGDLTMAAAGLDNHDIPAMKTTTRKGNRILGTRGELLEILWYIEAAPAFFALPSEGSDPQERAAVIRTSKAWRKALGLGPNDKIPVPASARR